MQTESTIHTIDVERTATISLVRVVDFDKIAADHPDGTLTVEELQTSGDFVVVVEPNGRDAKQLRTPVKDETAGYAWLDGFAACAALKKKTPKTPEEKAAAKKKREATKKKKEREAAKAAGK